MNPQVNLISNIETATGAMAYAARMCYGQEDKCMTVDEASALLERVLARKHFSILEHASASFHISNVSRNFTHQLVRHRHMSFAQQSFHYTVATDQDYPVYPDMTDGVARVMKGAFEQSFCIYNTLLKLGVPKEEARHVLPSGISTRIVATANLREWVQFVGIRICKVNCYEIQEVARQVAAILSEQLPFLRHHLGPTCYTQRTCNEGKKFCGKPWSVLK